MKKLRQFLAIIAVGIVLITGVLPGYGLAAEDPAQSGLSRADDSIKVLELRVPGGAVADPIISVGAVRVSDNYWYVSWDGMPTWERLPDWTYSPSFQSLGLTFEFVIPDASGTGYTQVPGTKALNAAQTGDQLSINLSLDRGETTALYSTLLAEAPEGLSCQIAAYEESNLIALTSPMTLRPVKTSLVPTEDTQISLRRDEPASFWLEILNFKWDWECTYALSLVTIDHDEVKLDHNAFRWWQVNEDGYKIDLHRKDNVTSEVTISAECVNTILDQMGTNRSLQYTVWARTNPWEAADGDLIIGPGPDAPPLTFINPSIPEDPNNPDKPDTPDVPSNGLKPTQGSVLEVIQPSGDSGGVIKTPDASGGGTVVSAFMAGLEPPDGYELRIVQGQSQINPESEGALVATGQQVLMDTATDRSQDSYEVVVPGDVLGTGIMNLSQLVRLVVAFSGKKPLEGPFERAGDLSGDSAISLVDVTQDAALYRRIATGET